MAVSHGVGCKHNSDPKLLWLWCRLAAAALIFPYAAGLALKKKTWVFTCINLMATIDETQQNTCSHWIPRLGCLASFALFWFGPCLWYVEVPRPGIKPTPQQQPEPLQ